MTDALQFIIDNWFFVSVILAFVIGILKTNSLYQKAKKIITMIVMAWQDDEISDEEFNEIIEEIKKDY